MKKNLVYLITASVLLLATAPTIKAGAAKTSNPASTFSTVTLKPGDSYDLPALTLSTTTPTSGKVMGYEILSRRAGEYDGFVSIEQTDDINTADTATMVGGSRQASYTVKISPDLTGGASFQIVETRFNAPRSLPIVEIQVDPSFPTITLAPGASYDLPPVTLSTTTPVPDKVTGYVIIPLNYQSDNLVSVKQPNADQTTNRTLMGGSRQVTYTLTLSKNIPKGAYFYIVPTTLERPTGDQRKTVAKVVASFPAVTLKPGYSTVTLKPGDSYELPPVVRSTTTPLPDEVTGYTVVPANFGPQQKDYVHIEKTTPPTSTDPNLRGASQTDTYTLTISLAIPKASHFSIIATTNAHPEGDVYATIVKVTIE